MDLCHVQVLQIIPNTMFDLLARIVKIQTSSIKELPTRLEKERMRDFAQLDSRYEVYGRKLATKKKGSVYCTGRLFF